MAEASGGVEDPSDTFLDVCSLILEGRLPCRGARRGYIEGPHCPHIFLPPGKLHQCAGALLCQRDEAYRQYLLLLWKNNVPVSIEVYLAPRCKHGLAGSRSVEPTVHVPLGDPSYCLIEQWILRTVPCQSPPEVHGCHMDGRSLLQAVRSHLHFSQLSSWLSRFCGSLPGNIIYRIAVGGDLFSGPQWKRDGGGSPHVQRIKHSFPLTHSGRNEAIMVEVRSVPRSDAPFPQLLCSSTDCSQSNRPAPLHSADASSAMSAVLDESANCDTSSYPAEESPSVVPPSSFRSRSSGLSAAAHLLGESLLDPPGLGKCPKRYQSPSRCGSPCHEAPDRFPTREYRGRLPSGPRSLESSSSGSSSSSSSPLCARRQGGSGMQPPSSAPLPLQRVTERPPSSSASGPPHPAPMRSQSYQQRDNPEEAMRKSWSDVPHGIHVAEYPLPVPGSSSLMPEEEERPVEDDVFRPRRRSLDSDKLPPSVPVSSCRPRGSSFSSTRDWRDWDSPSPQFDGVCSSGSVQEDTQNPAPSPDAETSDESPSGSGRQPPAPRTPSKATSIPKIIQKSQLPKDAFLSRQQMQSRMKTKGRRSSGTESWSGNLSWEDFRKNVTTGSSGSASQSPGPPSITGFDLAPFEVEEVLNVLRSDIRIQPPWQRRRRGTSNKEKSNDRASSNALKSMEQNCNPLNKSEEPMSSVCDTIPSKSSSEGVLTPQCDDLSVVERKTPSPPPRTFQHPSPSSAGYRMTKPSLQLDKCGASCHHPPLVFRSPDRPTARALKFEHKPEPQVCHSPHSSSPTSQNSSPLPPSDISSSPCSSAVECLGSQSHKSPLLVDHFQRSVPSVSDQLQFRRSLDGAASLVFHRRTGLPLTSSPAPKRKGKAFDFDAGINSVTAIKNALFAVNIKDEEDADVETSLETSLVDSPESFSNNSPGEFNTDISSIRSSRPTSLSPQSFRNVSLIPLTKDITLPPPLSPTEEEKSVKISHSCPPSPPSHLSPLPSSPATSNLLGSFEESVLNGRIEPISTVHGFKADIGASGSFCPSHLTQPVSVFFYSLEGNSSPYLAHINLGKKGYRVPRSGTIQVTLFNPHGTVVKMFVILYDLSDMPPSSKTFLRQRTLYMPVGETDLSSESRKWLRYLIHLRFCTSKSGHLYLHTDIRMIVFRKSDLDTAVSLETDGKTHELRSFTRGPTDPKYSPKR